MGFGGQVVSWTTQDSKAPRISLQRRRFPPIRPKPGQKRHIRESARWKRPDLVGWHLARAVEAPGPGELAPGPGAGVSSCGHCGGHYQAILWLGAPALRPQLGQI